MLERLNGQKQDLERQVEQMRLVNQQLSAELDAHEGAHGGSPRFEPGRGATPTNRSFVDGERSPRSATGDRSMLNQSYASMRSFITTRSGTVISVDKDQVGDLLGLGLGFGLLWSIPCVNKD